MKRPEILRLPYGYILNCDNIDECANCSVCKIDGNRCCGFFSTRKDAEDYLKGGD